MPRRSEAEFRSPQDFAPLLATKEPVLLVGGQAVNLWALYYHTRTIELGPFVSLNADVLGDRETLEEIGKVTGTKPQYFPLRPPTNEIGVVIPKDSKGTPILIEVLRYVHGASNEELRDPTYTMALGATHVRVPGPIVLLQAKIANVSEFSQTDRQDSRHVLILSRLMPAYLSDLQVASAEGRMAERKFIMFLERLLRILTAENGHRVFATMELDRRSLFEGLGHDKLPKLNKFLTKRLTRELSEYRDLV